MVWKLNFFILKVEVVRIVCLRIRKGNIFLFFGRGFLVLYSTKSIMVKIIYIFFIYKI